VKRRLVASAFAIALWFAAGAAGAGDPPRRGLGAWRFSIDHARGRPPAGEVTWMRNGTRGEARHQNGRLHRARLSGRGLGAVESWHGGLLAIQWGAGASALPRAAPGVVQSVAAGGPTALAGAALSARLFRGKLLVAAGNSAAPAAGGAGGRSGPANARMPLGLCAFARGGTGLLIGGGPGWRPLLSVYLSGRRHGSHSEIELALAGEERGLAGRIATSAAGLETTMGLRFRAGRGAPLSGARGRGDLDLDLLVRGAARRFPVAVGARAEQSDPRRTAALMMGGEPAGAAAARRAWLDLALPFGPDRSHAFLHGEIRVAGGRDRSRLRLGLATPLSRVAVDWTSGGGLGLGCRWRWDLLRPLTLEAGAATWSGPLADTGATVDLPHVPEHGLAAQLAVPGHAAAVLMDWQMAQVRVRLGLATRRSHEAVPDIQVAARLDWAWPPAVTAPRGDP
jgi:hypothetical protein